MASHASAGRRETILVGSSNPSVRCAAQNDFDAAGFAVTTAADGAGVMDAAHRQRPDLVLLAFEQMDGDGFSLCARLGDLDRSDPIPVVVAVDANDGNAVARAFSAGAADVVSLPIAWSVLVQRAHRLMQMTRSHAELRRTRVSLESVQRIAGVGSWAWNVDTGAMQWSRQMYTILNFEPGGVKAEFAQFTLCMHPEDRDAAVSLLDEAVNGLQQVAA